MSVASVLESKLTQKFTPSRLDILDESHRHAGTATETHFKVALVSDVFQGMGLVKRHQAVYSLLAEELRGGVHALALHLYTEAEWLAQGESPESPNCRGGN